MLFVRRLASAYRAAFSGLPKEVWLLALGAFVNRSGTMVLPFLSLYLTSRLGMSAVEAGRVLALPMSNAVVASRAPLRRTGAYMGAYTVAFSLAFVAAGI